MHKLSFLTLMHSLVIVSFTIANICKCTDIDYDSLPVQIKYLKPPSLETLASVLQNTLRNNFAYVDVDVVECPDLTQGPFYLVKPGLSGNTKLLQVGGMEYLVPVIRTDKIYELREIASLMGVSSAFAIGPGGVSYTVAATNCEAINNVFFDNNTLDQQSRMACPDVTDENNVLQIRMPENETRISFTTSLFLSDGSPGHVLKVHVKNRTGNLDFPESIRQSLSSDYPAIGLGGTFVVKKGIALEHVVRNYSKLTEEEVEQEKYVNYYELCAPQIAVGTLYTSDLDVGFTLQHYHTFSNHGQAGHYHNDTTPHIVEYLGYFNTGEVAYFIDNPSNKTSR